MRANIEVRNMSPTTSGLDPTIAAKIAVLRDAQERARAVSDHVGERCREAADDLARARQARERYMTDGGRRMNPGQQYAATPAMDEAVAAAQAEHDRLRAEQERLNATLAPGYALLRALDDLIKVNALRGRNVTVAPAPGGGPEDWLADVETL